MEFLKDKNTFTLFFAFFHTFRERSLFIYKFEMFIILTFSYSVFCCLKKSDFESVNISSGFLYIAC